MKKIGINRLRFRKIPGFFAFFLAFLSIQAENGVAQKSTGLTANQVVETIKANLNCPWGSETVDTFKSGDPDTPVTGVATTFMSTYPVLEKAVALHCNFIITHEPTYYNHLDELDWAGKDDPVVAAKLKYINDHHLIIFRLHDHWHCNKPDGILKGMVLQLGWTKYQSAQDPNLFVFPKTTLKEFAARLKRQFPGSAIRVVGDPDQVVRNVAYAAGAPGAQAQMALLRRDDVDAVVSGESREWETPVYVLDASAEGKAKGVILIGHANSEEGGMAYFTDWLKPLVPGVNVHFVPAGNPIWMP